MTNHRTVQENFDADAGVTTMGYSGLRNWVAEALTKVPEEIAERVYSEVRFVMPTAGTKGQYFSRAAMEGMAVVVLSEAILSSDQETYHTILHEVAHHVLGHQPWWFLPENHDMGKDEAEAEALTIKWLSEAG
jgi:hypothetical protein